MPENKTKATDASVEAFLHAFDERKRNDSLEILEMMEDITGMKPYMYGSTIIGFGNYHYKYASGHEGDAPVLGFSPRKAALTFYVYSDTERSKLVLADLGKFKMSKACIYVKKLSDINLSVLKELCIESIKYISEHHECSCRVK